MSACRSCGASITWALTVNGKRMPVDAEPSENGNVELITDGRYVLAVVHSQPPMISKPLHVSHFVSCPDADEHRR
jgi:hypothetical protein